MGWCSKQLGGACFVDHSVLPADAAPVDWGRGGSLEAPLSQRFSWAGSGGWGACAWKHPPGMTTPSGCVHGHLLQVHRGAGGRGLSLS